MKIIYLVTEYTQWKSEHHSFVSGTAVYTNRKDAARHEKLMTYETALKDCYCTMTIIKVDSTDLDHLAEVVRCNIAVDKVEYEREEKERKEYWENLNKPKPRPDFVILTEDNKLIASYPDFDEAKENCPAGHYITTADMYNPKNKEVQIFVARKPY
jgi:hypothetical protein